MQSISKIAYNSGFIPAEACGLQDDVILLCLTSGGVRHDPQRFMGKTVYVLISIVTRSSSHLVREMDQNPGSKFCFLC